MSVQVILLERIEKLGQMGDVVAVKPGFARNFLLPQGKAVRASESNMKQFEAKRAQLEAENLERKKDAERVAEDLDGLSVVIIRAASDTGQLYGSVNARDIAQAITEAGVTIARTQVMMEKPVKTLGVFDFRVKLHPEVIVDVQINVAQSQEEAEAQAERVARGEAAVVTEAEIAAREIAEEAEAQAAAIAQAAADMATGEAAETLREAAEEIVEEVREAAGEPTSGDDEAADKS
ncbi:MAG: 50S ribosomal protein L9 [Alphaproteobacteria bacterium]|nr:50S ribosomal protein L9 [Alphaproteobacteria bacterium]